MIQPQSPDELRPIIERLQSLDALLDLRWDPKAVVLTTGSYSALGVRIDPTYDGRWMVIRYDSPTTGHAGVHEGRGYTVLCHLTEWTKDNGIIRMVALRDGGSYVPVGEWVVEMMYQSDSQNVRAMEEIRRRLWAEDERAHHTQDAEADAQLREALDHVHFTGNYAGGVGNWQGRGGDFAEMAAARTAHDAQRTADALSHILPSNPTPNPTPTPR